VAKPKTYTARSTINELNHTFYDRYDPSFLFNKAITLRLVTTEREKFTEALASFDSYSELASYINDQYFEALRAELHFMETHQFEAFFALMMAAFQDKPHWLYLTEYTNAQIKTAVGHFLDGDVTTLTGGVVSNEHDFVTWTIYEQQKHDTPEWNTNLDNHWWLLQRMAERYRQAADAAEYNSYKHGLRIMTGPALWSLNDPDEPDVPLLLHESQDSITYLDLRKTDEGYLQLFEVTKQFNPEESFFYVNLMYHMLDTMTKLRRARYSGVAQGVQGHTIFDLDKDDILALGFTNASLSMSL